MCVKVTAPQSHRMCVMCMYVLCTELEATLQLPSCQGVSHGPQHRLHLLRRPVPRAEALHQADQGDEDEHDRALLHILCGHDRCTELCSMFRVLTRHL